MIDAYHQLWHIEKAFRMSKHDLQARPIYHHTRDSIEAHLSIVFAAMAVSHWIETPNRLEHQEIRPHRTPLPHRQIKAGRQILTAADPLPDDLRRSPRQDQLSRQCALTWPKPARNVRTSGSLSKSTETFPATPYPSAFSVSFSAASGCSVSSGR